jgi:large subunit ribosomal protein L18
MDDKKLKRLRRHRRVRAKMKGTAKIPRFCVFRSNKYIYGQLINDEKGKTLFSANDKGLKAKNKIEAAKEVGKLIAQKAVEQKITKAVFDRGGYKYHGRVKSLAEGAREGGLKF